MKRSQSGAKHLCLCQASRWCASQQNRTDLHLEHTFKFSRGHFTPRVPNFSTLTPQSHQSDPSRYWSATYRTPRLPSNTPRTEAVIPKSPEYHDRPTREPASLQP